MATTPDDICDAVHDHADKCDGCRAKALEEAATIVEASATDGTMRTWLAAQIRKASPLKPDPITLDSLMNDIFLALRVLEHEHKAILRNGATAETIDGNHQPGKAWHDCPTCRAVYNADEALSMLRDGVNEGRAAFENLERWIARREP